MTIPSVNSVTGLPTQNGGSRTESSNQMDMEMFLVLLSVQLSTQNPLEPMSDRDFFAQMAQLGTVQGMDNLNASMESSQAAAMLGKKVTALLPYTDSTSGLNEVVTGTVKKVTFKAGEMVLGIDDGKGIVEVKIANVRTIESS